MSMTVSGSAPVAQMAAAASTNPAAQAPTPAASPDRGADSVSLSPAAQAQLKGGKACSSC